MRVDADMGYQSDAAEDGIDIVIENPIRNAVKYTIMRVVRFVLTLACESVAAVCALLSGAFSALLVGFLLFTLAWLALGVEHWAFGQPHGPHYWYAMFKGDDPRPWLEFMQKHPYLVAPPAFGLLLLAWGQALALGAPYRWRNMPPGSGAVKCGLCRKTIIDSFRCSQCQALRPSYFVMRLIWAVNVGITSLWVAHDCVFGFVGFSSRK